MKAIIIAVLAVLAVVGCSGEEPGPPPKLLNPSGVPQNAQETATEQGNKEAGMNATNSMNEGMRQAREAQNRSGGR